MSQANITLQWLIIFPWSQRSYNPLIPKTPGSFLTVCEFVVSSRFVHSSEKALNWSKFPKFWKLSETTTSITHYFLGQAIVRRGNRGHLIWPTETLEHDFGANPSKWAYIWIVWSPKKHWVAFTNPLCIHLKLLHVLSPPQQKKCWETWAMNLWLSIECWNLPLIFLFQITKRLLLHSTGTVSFKKNSHHFPSLRCPNF